jgi:hypothetical protein
MMLRQSQILILLLSFFDMYYGLLDFFSHNFALRRWAIRTVAHVAPSQPTIFDIFQETHFDRRPYSQHLICPARATFSSSRSRQLFLPSNA